MISQGPPHPMWQRFRDLCPEVTLVLIPPTLSPTEAGLVSETAPQANVPDVDLDTALSEAARRARLAAGMFDFTTPLSQRWGHSGARSIRPRLVVSGPLVRLEEFSGDALIARLERLGWTAVERPSKGLIWVEGTSEGHLLRITIADGAASVLVLGSRLAVPPEQARALTSGPAEPDETHTNVIQYSTKSPTPPTAVPR